IERAWRDQHPDFESILARSTENVAMQIESLRRIASDFSAYAAFPKTDRKPHSLQEILGPCLELYDNRESSGIDIKLESSLDDDVMVLVDADELRRVFFNLFNNAFEAMPEGGTLSVSSYVLESEDLGEIVELRIKDTGRGIAADVERRLFEPYFTTRSSGTGLGLAICKKTIEGYGGTIQIESEEGRGTTAVIRLPIYRPTEA
ncbi:MAG: GHKL domain-containing protein, partial [Planctomycetes bacterium]|nr:GHKL domain-containing protein [Planctomycetota bacterium]